MASTGLLLFPRGPCTRSLFLLPLSSRAPRPSVTFPPRAKVQQAAGPVPAVSKAASDSQPGGCWPRGDKASGRAPGETLQAGKAGRIAACPQLGICPPNPSGLGVMQFWNVGETGGVWSPVLETSPEQSVVSLKHGGRPSGQEALAPLPNAQGYEEQVMTPLGLGEGEVREVPGGLPFATRDPRSQRNVTLGLSREPVSGLTFNFIHISFCLCFP